MTGFASGDAAGVVATWVAALLTLAVWSYFLGGSRIFRLAQYLLAGLATGYLVVLAVSEVLLPDLVRPLLADPGDRPLLWLALLLVALMAGARWLPARVVAFPVSLLVAGTAAFALGGAVVGTVLPQLGASLLPSSATWAGLINGTISLSITVLVLLGFLHGVRRRRLAAGAASVGRWLLLGGLGGWLGFLLVSRLAVLVDRVDFMLGDWLGLVR